MLNRSEKQRIANHALGLMKLWRTLIDKSNGDCWYEATARQAYQDCMNSLKANKFITDYNIRDVTVTLADGSVHSANYKGIDVNT